MKKRLNPIEKYPQYFSLFQGKPVFLSTVEAPMLRGAVGRLLEDGTVIGMKVRKTDGPGDMIVK